MRNAFDRSARLHHTIYLLHLPRTFGFSDSLFNTQTEGSSYHEVVLSRGTRGARPKSTRSSSSPADGSGSHLPGTLGNSETVSTWPVKTHPKQEEITRTAPFIDAANPSGARPAVRSLPELPQLERAAGSPTFAEYISSSSASVRAYLLLSTTDAAYRYCFLTSRPLQAAFFLSWLHVF